MSDANTGGANLYEPCQECKKKRTLCIRVRRPGTLDFGHAALSVQEPLADGSTRTTTYGNWPNHTSGGNDVQKNFAGDDFNKDKRFKPKDVKCRELTEEQEKKLKEELDKKQVYDYTDNNCARWSGSTWNSVTGDSLNYGGSSNWVYNSPTTLGDSIKSSP